MSQILLVSFLFSAVRLATPLLLAALGGLYSERGGVINIALEGLLLAGRVHRRRRHPLQRQPVGGAAGGDPGGDRRGLIHGVACIRYRADQVVSGTAINILFLGVPALLSGALFESTGATPQIPQGQLLPLAPIVLAFALVPATWWVLYRTPFGLRLRAVGENPEAADTAGIDVARLRYAGVLISGALAAIGGAYLSIGQASLFTRNMSAGRGFIALAALIFGKWRPVQTMLACLLFGAAEALSIQMQGVSAIPVQFIQIIPYVLTIVVLAGFIGHSRAPRALGLPYQKKR